MLVSVQITNVTRHVILATHARVADNSLTRLMGLLGKRAFPEGQALVLRPCSGIHTVGMRFAIDALYLDARRRVIHAVSDLGPWRFGPLDPATACVVEMPAGTIATTATAIGDEIFFSED